MFFILWNVGSLLQRAIEKDDAALVCRNAAVIDRIEHIPGHMEQAGANSEESVAGHDDEKNP